MLRKVIGLSIFLCLVVFVVPQVTAQTDTTEESPDATNLLPETTRERLDSIRQNAANRSTTARETVQDRRAALSETIGELRREKAAEVQQLRLANQAENEQRRADFEEKVAELTDQRKAAIVERIGENLNSINENVTNRMFDFLERLENAMTRIQEKIDSSTGDTTEIQALFDTAQSSIDEAKDAVTQQAANEYVIDLTTEAALRSNVAIAVNQLKTDLRNTHVIVKSAKEAVRDVARALIQLNNGPETDTDTPATGSGL